MRTAAFEVHRAFVLEGRSLFGLAGVFIEGMAQVGMCAVLEGDDEAFSARVHGIEFVEEPAASGAGRGEPVLLFSYSRAEKLERWSALDWSGRRLRLEW